MTLKGSNVNRFGGLMNPHDPERVAHITGIGHKCSGLNRLMDFFKQPKPIYFADSQADMVGETGIGFKEEVEGMVIALVFVYAEL